MPLVIKHWDDVFENAQSRKVERAQWVPMPNKHDGKGFRRIMAMARRCEVFTGWVLMVELASKMPKRGVLADSDGELSCTDMALKTGCPEAVFEVAIEALADPKVGWIYHTNQPEGGLPLPLRSQRDTSPAHRGGTEWNGREGNGREGKKSPGGTAGEPRPPAPTVKIARADATPWQRMIDHIHASFTARKGLPPEWTEKLLARLKAKAKRFEPEGVMALWDLACSRLWHAERAAERDAFNARRWRQDGHSVLFFLDVLSEELCEDDAWKAGRERHRTALLGAMPVVGGKRWCRGCKAHSVEVSEDRKFLTCGKCNTTRGVRPEDKLNEEATDGTGRRDESGEGAGGPAGGGRAGSGDTPAGGHGRDPGPGAGAGDRSEVAEPSEPENRAHRGGAQPVA